MGAFSRFPIRAGALVAVSLLVAGVSFPVHADIPASAYQRLNLSLTRHHVVPRYEKLVAAATALRDSARIFCADREPVGLEDLRGAYQATTDAWMGVQHIGFGPAEGSMRLHRLYFWPDTRGVVDEHLAEFLSARDTALLEPAAFGSTSVAVQGLPALERLLFEERAAAKLMSAGADADYRCRLIDAIARNVEIIAADILAGWKNERDGFAHLVITAPEGNARYFSADEVTRDFHKSLSGALEAFGQLKLERLIGDSPETAAPQQVESPYSRRSLRNLILNLEALRGLYLGEGGFGFDDLLRRGAGTGLDGQIRASFERALEFTRGVEPPLGAALRSPEQRTRLRLLASQIHFLHQYVERDLAAALGISMGFNALDGD